MHMCLCSNCGIFIHTLSFSVCSSVRGCADSSSYNPKQRYCFRFTWIGPTFNNESDFQNATCDDIVGDRAQVPCTRPLVVTGEYSV